MNFAAMNSEQIALLVALVGVFGGIPVGWLIHGIVKDKRDGSLPSDDASVEVQTGKPE
ncbi:hypothetical protein JC795_17655 [Pseudomonas veronii]|uniref:hypothetical protein n=1 Tax=Pseudomonas TaxID=286 RepID=UPI0018E74FAA|nr:MULTISPECIES: hypothetical protein [Pseudomonas]MBJ2180019.1 hypothetical protein [Pseudomonas veronii]MDB1113887.1 hypothetical protein [Pseudomonas extremaustralis]